MNIDLNFFFKKGHIYQYVELLKNEKGSKDDGLVHRFLINAPKPVFHLAEDMMLAPELNCSLRTILYLIYKNNLTESNIMRLSDEYQIKPNANTKSLYVNLNV